MLGQLVWWNYKQLVWTKTHQLYRPTTGSTLCHVDTWSLGM